MMGLVTIAPQDLLHIAIAGYVGLAVILGWFVIKVGQGKPWARSSFLWGLVLQALITLVPPYQPLAHYLGDVPDLGLQIYALVLLYMRDCNAWFAYDTTKNSKK
jgi:hypothetical protein